MRSSSRTASGSRGRGWHDSVDHTIVVAASGPKMYVKQGGTWVTVTKAYRKVSGAWQEVALADAFSSSGKYVVG